MAQSEAAAGYDFAAPQFQSELAPDSTSRAVLEKWALLLPPGARVLDVGCGAGRATRWLESAGFSVLSLDLSTAMLRRTMAGRMRALPAAPAALDGLTAFFCVMPVIRAEVPFVLAGFRRVLKPGGAILIAVVRAEGESDEAADWAGGRVLHFTGFVESDLAPLLEDAGFRVIGSHTGESVFHGQPETHLFVFAR